MPVRSLDIDGPIDVRATLRPKHLVRRERVAGTWWSGRSPDGAFSINFRKYGSRIEFEAWGPGAGWALEYAPDFVGASDKPQEFAPNHHLIDQLARRAPGMRMGASRLMWEALFYAVIHQKVTGAGAGRSMRRLTFAVSEPAPGPSGLMLMPSPERIAAMPYYDFHPFGIEKKRADSLREVARRPRLLKRLSHESPEEADRILQALPGIGIWTSAIVRGEALGDPDAVPVGDYHVKNTVAWGLAGEPRGSDERMLELLEPFRGHRLRVVRLLKSGGIGAPKYGPRSEIRSFERQ
ncbi:MAG: DNA-3-methyladenine glycosylase 2 family protein [Acidimicrobiia bacterium]|nr:DNA-3-methyladenine glycosylase 2 family protein [Acidimicrobiia bacterium]